MQEGPKAASVFVGEKAAAIDLGNDAERAAWCAELDISEQALRSVVGTVGPMPAAVRFFVQGSRRQIHEPTAAHKAAHLAQRALRATRTRNDLKEPEREAKPLELDRLVVELRAGTRGDREFAQAVARFCARLADARSDRGPRSPGEVIRTLFRIS